MGFERVAIFGLVDVDMHSTSGGFLHLLTDLPGGAMAQREEKAFLPMNTRGIVRFRLKYNTKGHLYSLKITPHFAGTTRLYGARIWARSLPGDSWQWYVVPIPETPSEWHAEKLLIPPTSDWGPEKLDIPPMGEWERVSIQIPPTTDWAPDKLPIKPTPENPEWVDIPTDS